MIEIIPAIDIIDGKCVRLSQGDYGQKTIYNENPLEVAKMFEEAGLKRLHLVDLDGAKAHHIVNHAVLKSIASNTKLIIDFGGGLKSDDDLRIAFECGASMVTGGSIAVKSPDIFIEWIEKYGAEKIILGADFSYALFFLKSLRKKLTKEEVPGTEQEIEMPPTQVSEITQLQGILQKISLEFGLKGDMELDDGHSLAYQVTHLFPELFELQKQKLE